MVNKENFSNISFVGASLISAVGLDFYTSCASARSGLMKSTEIELSTVNAEGDLENIVAYSVPIINNGFEGDARLVNMLSYAFQELKQNISQAMEAQSRIGIYIAAPSAKRCFQFLDRIEDEDIKNHFLEKRLYLKRVRMTVLELKKY